MLLWWFICCSFWSDWTFPVKEPNISTKTFHNQFVALRKNILFWIADIYLDFISFISFISHIGKPGLKLSQSGLTFLFQLQFIYFYLSKVKQIVICMYDILYVWCRYWKSHFSLPTNHNVRPELLDPRINHQFIEKWLILGYIVR